MAVDDIQILHAHFPDAFDRRPLARDWQDWRRLPISRRTSAEPQHIEDALFQSPLLDREDTIESLPRNVPDFRHIIDPARPSTLYPGMPHARRRRRAEDWLPLPASPDELAFYLPFHYYDFDYPAQKESQPWGLYIMWAGREELAAWLSTYTNHKLSLKDAREVSTLFLHGVQAFHHIIECFATRLELIQRTPVYKTGVAQLFQETHEQPACLEEALAAAYGLQRVRRLVKDKQKRRYAMEALCAYLTRCPAAYNRGKEFLNDRRFKEAQHALAEENYRTTFPTLPQWNVALWANFNFRGIARVDSKVCYLKHRSELHW